MEKTLTQQARELAETERNPGNMFPSAPCPLAWQQGQALALVSIAESLETIAAYVRYKDT